MIPSIGRNLCRCSSAKRSSTSTAKPSRASCWFQRLISLRGQVFGLGRRIRQYTSREATEALTTVRLSDRMSRAAEGPSGLMVASRPRAILRKQWRGPKVQQDPKPRLSLPNILCLVDDPWSLHNSNDAILLLITLLPANNRDSYRLWLRHPSY